MSSNNSTFDSGFNITTADLSAVYANFYTKTQLLTDGAIDGRYYTKTNLNTDGVLDSRYFSIATHLSELTASAQSQVSASRYMFGYSLTGPVTTDCIIRTSGSGNVLRFNGTTSSFSTAGGPAAWYGSVIYDTSIGKLYYANATKWLNLIDSSGGTVEGNLKISGSYDFIITGSSGAKISIYLDNPGTKDLEISASTYDSNILFKNDLMFRSSSNNIIGSIQKDGVLNFSSGSFTLGKNSVSANVIYGNLSLTNTLNVAAISCSGDIIAFSTSDKRLKNNIISLSNNLEKLDLIGAYSFDWAEDSGKCGYDIGVLAQEIESVFPHLVTIRDNGYRAVDYQRLIPFLIGCIKELKIKLDTAVNVCHNIT